MGKQITTIEKEDEKHNLFVWKKKKKVPFNLKSEKRKQRERLKELERLRNRRQEIANQKTKFEEDKRQTMAYQFQHDWENRKQEDQRFLYQQSLLRSDIRLRQGRPKPIDLLRRRLHSGGDADDVGSPVYVVLKGLPLKDLEELLDGIKLNLEFDTATPTYTQFWQSLLLLCDWQISQLQAVAADHDSLQHKSKLELHSSIEEDVEYLLKGKTYKELEDLHSQTESQLHSGNAKVVEFWEALLTRLRIYKARACLDEIPVKLLSDVEPSSTAANNVIQKEPADNGEVIDMPCEDLERKCPADQQCRLQDSTMGKYDDALLVSDAEVVNLDSQVYYWSDKYNPRKPKYLNRVLTGYEWNKYNRTHYDHDSLPPKAVQGYRFNILYPDLLDKSKTPQFTIEKDGSNAETCIIRFCAGPPYQDIAFRIVNKEWRTSKKDGFKCTFEAGTLRLHFNLQRYPYRR